MNKIQKDINKIALVGTPNVGKSVVFGQLTGTYAVVANYPGTTVEITRGKMKTDKEYEICDTPGMYSFMPITEEERVARSIIFEESPEVIIHVADAKNIERMLGFTMQLLEAGLPVILVLNLMDEAEKVGMTINVDELSKKLQIPVISTIAPSGIGIDKIKEAIAKFQYVKDTIKIEYDSFVEDALAKITALLPAGIMPMSSRATALLALQDDREVVEILQDRMGDDYNTVAEIIAQTTTGGEYPLTYYITMSRQRAVQEILKSVVVDDTPSKIDFRERMSRMMMHPLWGIPILLAILFVFYEIVGVFGAQFAVNYLETVVFGKYLLPPVTHFINSIIPWQVGRDLFVNEYGIFTLGLRYAFAIILPIVTTFFIVFSIMEDSGYMPRLAMLIDRIFKAIGLNGRAVIPMVLGFGCATMATIVTRTLESRRERIIATFLLALTIPCSAQMGVILALLGGHILSLWIFIVVMAANFLLIGFLTAQFLPGEKPIFYMEIPPLRVPTFKNVMVKTYTRVEWYLKEILPLFILASVFIWVGRLTGLFDILVSWMSYPVQWIGLPKEAAVSFLYGFFRRDYGAAGLYDLHQHHILQSQQLIVAVVTMALFMPCVAQFAVAIKERGWGMALGMAAFIFPYAFIIGYLVNMAITTLGVQL
ncbi:MAG: ferrous iron transport protein B [bacterium]